MNKTHILIAGAGPTGLVLALWLKKAGIDIRIIDKLSVAGTTSRALVIHAKTLEYYRQLGIADETIKRGIAFDVANLWARGRQVARIPVGDLGRGVSAFPYMVIFPQDRHEALLIEELSKLGVTVERETELVSFKETAQGIEATLKHAGGREEMCAADYLAGCDGARSIVRDLIGAGFPGGTYDHMFYVADIDGEGPVVNGELHGALDDAGFLAIFPMQGNGCARLVGQVEAKAGDDKLEWYDVSQLILQRLNVRINSVHWFSTYRVHHRVAGTFQKGRAFLLGDAGHIHSPVGGQGMNTGIGDAVNLAWKLADAVRGRARPEIVNSYAPERMAFAHQLINSTDRAFQFVLNDGPIAKFVRLNVVPRLLPLIFKLGPARKRMFRILSQTAIEYRASDLSDGAAGLIRAGDRLPWIESIDNYAALDTRDWQVHVYGTTNAALEILCANHHLPLKTFAWNEVMTETGFAADTPYLIRPDGYVAYAGNEAGLSAYLNRWSLSFPAA